MKSVFQFAYECLLLDDPADKCTAVFNFQRDILNNHLNLTITEHIYKITHPGRPAKPKLVLPKDLPKRSLSTEQGRIALIHAITHIEFNAINLALDAIYRFQEMPEQFYLDWLKVANEEAEHFMMLRNRLNQLNYDYGDFDAHNGLWEMAVKTSDDVMVRMALVPRVLEARGLDVTPSMIKKFEKHGDRETVSVLNIIFEQEIGHVAIGSYWFKFACEQKKLDPEQTFQNLLQKHFSGELRGPFQIQARLSAGFSRKEIEALQDC